MAENQESTTTQVAAPAATAPAQVASGDGPRPAAASGDAPRPYGGPRGPRPGGDRRPRQGGPGGGKKFFRRRKVDYFSVNKIDDINYKNVDSLRNIALLPFAGDIKKGK